MPALFQAEIRPARVFRNVIEALKEVVTELHLECTETDIIVQAMDSSHVSLVSLLLSAEGFLAYRCEKSMSLGVNVANLVKILKCAGNDDTIQLSAEDGGDVLKIKLSDQNESRVSDFAMKLMEIEGLQLGIPQQEYKASVEMPSAEFTRVIRDITSLGDTAHISVAKSGVNFAVNGDIGSVNLHMKATSGEPTAPTPLNATGTKKEEEEKKVKPEPGTERNVNVTVKQEDGAKPGEKRTRIHDDDDFDAKKPKKAEKVQVPKGVKVVCEDTVSLQFALRYLAMFTKAGSCGEVVRLRMAKDVPLQVEFDIEGSKREGEDTPRLGVIRYYLAPKVGDDDAGAGDAAAETNE